MFCSFLLFIVFDYTTDIGETTTGGKDNRCNHLEIIKITETLFGKVPQLSG